MDTADRDLLERIVEGNRDLERLESLLGEFNLFESLGVVRQEVRHSDFLRFLLDPSESHGLSDTFLKSFLKRVVRGRAHPQLGAVEVDIADVSDAISERERLSIDILVHSDASRIVLAIENKVDSGEHSDQLQRYRAALEREFPEHTRVLVFLSPEGDEPSDGEWIPLGYSDVAEVVDGVMENRRGALGADVLVALRHYSTVIRRHLVSESDVAELCRRLYRAHKKAFDLVFEHRPDLQSDVADALQKVVSKHPEFELDYCSKSYVRFFARQWDADPRQKQGGGWTRSGRILLFELQNHEDSLRLKLIVGPGDTELRQQIFDFAQANKAQFHGSVTRLYPRWTQVFAMQLLQAKDYDASPEELIDQATSKLGAAMERAVVPLVALLRQVFRGTGKQ